jgi:chromate transporter
VVILIVARILRAFKESPLVAAVFGGLRPAATGLIAAAGFGVIRLSLYDGAATAWYGLIRWREGLLFLLIFLLIYRFKKHPVVYIAAAGIAGLVLGL